jgi:hypothetical protein
VNYVESDSKSSVADETVAQPVRKVDYAVSSSRLLGVLTKMLYASLFLVIGAMLIMDLSWIPDVVKTMSLIVGVIGLVILAPICGILGLIAYFAKRRRVSINSA